MLYKLSLLCYLNFLGLLPFIQFWQSIFFNSFFCIFNFSEARKPESEDVFMHEDEEANVPDEGKNDEAGGWTEIKETDEDERSDLEDKEELVPDETIHEVAVGKGLSGALKLLKDRGTLKETVEWGGRNMDKKKSKLVGIVDDDEAKDAHNKKEIRIERTDEFGRIVSVQSSKNILFIVL